MADGYFVSSENMDLARFLIGLAVVGCVALGVDLLGDIW